MTSEACGSCGAIDPCHCESLYCEACGGEITVYEQNHVPLCFEHQGHARCCAQMPHNGETPWQEGP